MLSRIPYSVRPGIGRVYRERLLDIERVRSLESGEVREYVFDKMYSIVKYAQTNIPFYSRFYKKNNYSWQDLRSFEDIQFIPVTSKGDFQQYELSIRSNELIRNKTKVNTGGSTGKPLDFYIESSSIGHERAHMMSAWREMLGYHPANLLATFNGRSDIHTPVKYDSLRHAYCINIYEKYSSVAKELKRINRPIVFLHGYPSAIHEFAIHCQYDQPLVNMLRRSLRGILLGSEFPNPHVRNRIEEIFQVKSLSWYGHTERCVFAYEKTIPNVYYPSISYGYAEDVMIDGKCCLIGTSYYNKATPLIRYNTEDLIAPLEITDGLMQSFEIRGGRSGEYIIDSDGNRVSLTGLIFGRHHRLFDFCSHIQVAQNEPGVAIIYYIPLSSNTPNDVSDCFDRSNVNMVFRFHRLEKPVKTCSGKINLLIQSEG